MRRLSIPRKRPYHGFFVAIVVFLSSGLAIGMAQYSFGEFAVPLQDEFGWSQTELNLALSISMVSGLSAPLIGYISDRVGTRPVIAVSLLLVALGFGLRPLITELWHWYLFSGLVYLGFPGATVLPSGKMVGLWFPETRGRVMGAVTSGNNFGGITMPAVAATVIAFATWETAYLTFAAIMVALAIVAFFVIRESTEDVEAERLRTGRGPLPGGGRRFAPGMRMRAAIKHPSFWLVIFGLTAATFTYQGILTQLRQHFGENGFQPALATAAVTIIAAMGIGSKLAFGRATEKFSARKMTVLSLVMQAAGVALMASPPNAALMWVGIFVFGLGFGGLGALIVLVVQETFGIREFGSIMGLFQLATIISFSGGPWMAGAIHDSTGEFDASFAIVVGIFIAGAIALFMARQPEWPEDTERPADAPTPGTKRPVSHSKA